MFKKLFGSKPAAPPPQPDPPPNPRIAALLQTVREGVKDDPFIGARLGAKEVFNFLVNDLENEKGIHLESLLCALGALAGYSCQANLRGQALARGMVETAAFSIVKTSDGKSYFFGDPLNQAVAGSPNSIWSIAAGAAHEAGSKTLPDINEMFQYTSEVLGSERFGVPRIPENHTANDLPINYLKRYWPVVFPTVKLFCPTPEDWPILLGFAIREAIQAGTNIIDPRLAIQILMESAIPMSKVDLANS